MTSPRATTYQAEILRFIHDQPSSTLRNLEVGVVKAIWDARGQLCGEHRGSISSALSDLESRGCVISETGTLGTGRRGRIAVAVVEEPPVGETVYHPQAVGNGHAGPGFDGPDRYPTAEEVAAELLKLAVAAAAVPVTDIKAALHHNECLRSEIDDWVQVAEETEDRARAANDELLALRIELDESQRLADKIDAEWTARYESLERVHRDRGEVIERLEKKLADEAPTVALHGRVKELEGRLTRMGAELSDTRRREQGLLLENGKLRDSYNDAVDQLAMVKNIATGKVDEIYTLLDEVTRRDLSAFLERGRRDRAALRETSS